MDGRRISADVVVIGGGLAGAAAAIASAMRGLRVVLCERLGPGRDRPGDTLHPGIEPVLRQLGIGGELARVVGARHHGVWVEWGGPPRFQPFGADEHGAWLGYQVCRADFDAMLLERARASGVRVLQPCTVSGCLWDDEHLSGVITSDGPIMARLVLDATGVSRWLSRTRGIRHPTRSPKLFARYGYMTGECPARDEAPALVGDARGWTWTARVGSGLYNWTRVDFAGPTDTAWLPEEFRGLKARGGSRGADVTWRLAAPAAGPGWFLIGDAAMILDPTSSHGVQRAIMSGMMAAHLAAPVLRRDIPADEAAAAYSSWLSDWFETDAAHLSDFYRELGAPGFARLPPADRSSWH